MGMPPDCVCSTQPSGLSPSYLLRQHGSTCWGQQMHAPDGKDTTRLPPQSPLYALQSACSVDRIDSALATVLPLVPGLAYFRFCCEDPRCGIELDEIDPEQWALLEVTRAYLQY